MGSHPYIGIVLLIVFIVIDAVLYCFQSALDSVNDAVVSKKSEEGDKKSEKILKLINNPSIFSNTLDVMVFITNVAVGAYILRVIAAAVENAAGTQSVWVIFLVAIVLLILLIVAGVLVPKRVGAKYPEKYLYKLAGAAGVFMALISPIMVAVTFLSSIVLRMIGINPKEDLDNVTEEEIITMVNEGQEQGVLEASEAEMITNIFEFGSKEAKDIMNHRSNIVAIDCQMSLNEAFNMMLSENFSRYPVYEEDIDHIVGMIYLRDAIMAYESGKSNDTKVKDIPGLIREAYFIPETRNIDALFKEMQAKKIHMGIVVDEYGQISGIVTMEDIIEEIMGNIFDEYDEEQEFIAKTAEDSYEVDGFTLLDDLEELLGITFDTEDYETVNGFVISNLHRLPEDNEQFEFEYMGYRFKVLEASNRVIKKVRITRLEKKDDKTSQEEPVNE